MPEHFVDPAMDMISKVMLKRDKLQAKVDELEKENQRLRKLLKDFEWSSYAIYGHSRIMYGVCPSCKLPKEDGHFGGCELAKELSDDKAKSVVK
jgi:hypothetical protein